MTRGRARRYLLVKQGYYPQVVADAGYTVFDWSTLNAGTLFQDSAKTTPASANGDVVGCWTDGVNGVDATQVTTANKPGLATGTLNGLPTLSFDGSDLLATGNISISTFAVWVVVQTTNPQDIIYEHSVNATANDGMSLISSVFPDSAYVRRGGVTSSLDAPSMAGITWRVVRHEHNGTQATHKIFFNDASVSTSAISNDIGTGTATAPLFIGARSGALFPITGNIAHLSIISPYPTDTSILANMESYINNLWNGVY